MNSLISAAARSAQDLLGFVTRLLVLGAIGALAVALMPATASRPPASPRPAIAASDWTQFHNGPTHQATTRGDHPLRLERGPPGGRLDGHHRAAPSTPRRRSPTAWSTSGPSTASCMRSRSAAPAAAGPARRSGRAPPAAHRLLARGRRRRGLRRSTTASSMPSRSAAPAAAGRARRSGRAPPAAHRRLLARGRERRGLRRVRTTASCTPYAVGCASGGGTCTPLWTGTTGGVISASPAVADGVVYVGSDDGKLYAFAVGCATGGGTCTPLWTATTGGTIVTPRPRSRTAWSTSGPTDDKLYAFAVGCASGGGSCTPLWTGTTGGPIDSSPAVANGVVYVGSDDGKLYAFAVGCASGGGDVHAAWTGTTGGASTPRPRSPTASSTSGPRRQAVCLRARLRQRRRDLHAALDGTTGSDIKSSPAVANGVVYVGSDDGKLYAFRPAAPHTTPSPRPASSTPATAPAVCPASSARTWPGPSR